MEPRPRGEPTFHLRVLVGAVVVDDQVDVEVFGHGSVNVAQKLQELLMAMAPSALREHSTGREVQSCKQCRRPMADVVVGDALDVSETQRQHRLSAIESL